MRTVNLSRDDEYLARSSPHASRAAHVRHGVANLIERDQRAAAPRMTASRGMP